MKTLFVSNLKIATVVLVIMGLIGTGAGTATHYAWGDKTPVPIPASVGRLANPPMAVAKPAPRDADKDVHKPEDQTDANERKEMIVTGKVLDAAGKPVPFADVAVTGWPKSRSRIRQKSPTNAFIEGKADGEGRFSFQVRQVFETRYRAPLVLARKEGHALGYQSLEADTGHFDTSLRLSPEHVFQGRLVDLQGQPAAGVKLSVKHIDILEGPRKSTTIAAYYPNSEERRLCWPEPVVTDQQGRFSLRNLAAGWLITLEPADDRFSRQRLVICAPGKGLSVQLLALLAQEGMGVSTPKKGASGEELTLALAPARFFEGTVTCSDTGKPVRGARVRIHTRPERRIPRVSGDVECRTDEKGHFRVIPYTGNFSVFTVAPSDGEPYLPLSTEFTWPKGAIFKQEINFALTRGILLRGTVTEKPSGQPVANAGIEFQSFRDNNPFFVRLPEGRLTAVTKPDGKFQMAVAPGPGHLLVNGPTSDYLHVETSTRKLYGQGINPDERHYPDALVSLNLKPHVKPDELEVTLQRGMTLVGHVFGPDGKPVGRPQMICRSLIHSEFTWRSFHGTTVRDGRFELPGCDPEKTVEVFFLDAINKLGAVAKLSASQAGKPPTVRLERCGSATARFVDVNGKPLVSFRPHLQFVLTPGIPIVDFSVASKGLMADTVYMWNVDPAGHGELSSDAQGRVTFPSLIPGATYWMFGSNPYYVNLHQEFRVKEGQSIDLGDIVVPKS